jgi:hypothetical protein
MLTNTPKSGSSTSEFTTLRLSGTVKDQYGNLIPSNINVIDEYRANLGDMVADSGIFELDIPFRDRVIVTAYPLVSDINYYIEIEGESRVSKYFIMSETVLPTTDDVHVDIVVPSASIMLLEAYDVDGNYMRQAEINNQVGPAGYGFSYGVFPIESNNIPIPTESSIGQLRGAWQDSYPSDWEVYFAIPPKESEYLTMLWTVPNIGPSCSVPIIKETDITLKKMKYLQST